MGRFKVFGLVVVVLGGAGLYWGAGRSGEGLSGTATSPCVSSATHSCAPTSIADAKGEAEWLDIEGLVFTNKNENGKGNTIHWWASHGAYTSSKFFFHLDAKKSKKLSFPCAMDHVFADNKGPANTVFTSTTSSPTSRPAVEAMDYKSPQPISSEGANFYGVRVLEVRNKSSNLTAYVEWLWQDVAAEYEESVESAGEQSSQDFAPQFGVTPYQPILDWDSFTIDYSLYTDKNQIDLGPGKTMQIVLPCVANIAVGQNSRTGDTYPNLEVTQLL